MHLGIKFIHYYVVAVSAEAIMVKPFFSTYINCCECGVAFISQCVFELILKKPIERCLNSNYLVLLVAVHVVKALCTSETHTSTDTTAQHPNTHSQHASMYTNVVLVLLLVPHAYNHNLRS